LKEKNLVIAETEYDEKFCSVFQKENIIGVQSHPEKSQNSGKTLLKNFLNIK
jgi:glutamine amidotransferase